MAFTYDTTTSAADDVAGTSQTMSHTCSADADLLVVGVYINSSADQITGVTYNGVAMTDLGFRGANGQGIGLFGLFSPATGANNVVASFSASRTSAIYASSFIGMDVTGSMPDSFASAYDASDSSDTNYATTAVASSGLKYLFGLGGYSPSQTLSISSGTKISQLDVNSGNAFVIAGYGSFAAAGSTSLGMSGWTGTQAIAGAIATFEQEGTRFVPKVIFI